MLRDLRNLGLQYVHEKWLRDVLILLGFTVVAAWFYVSDIILFNDLSYYELYEGINRVRGIVTMLWIVATIFYSFFTLFAGYGDVRRAYAGMLLPASTEAKFAWELLRTLVIFPAAALGAWYAFDAAYMCRAVARIPEAPEVLAAVESIGARIVAVREPLNYLPCMLYVLVFFNSAAMVARSCTSRTAAVVLMAAALIFPAMPFMDLYPFISAENHVRWGIQVNDFHSAVTWRSRVSWCSCMTEYVLRYAWYAALPAVLYAFSYFKLKERRLQ